MQHAEQTGEAIRFNEGLLEELGEHWDEDQEQIQVFRYSDDLIDFMNGCEVYDPTDAYDTLLDIQEGLWADLEAAGY